MGTSIDSSGEASPAGTGSPVLSRPATWTFDEVAEAHRLIEANQLEGKAVVAVR